MIINDDDYDDDDDETKINELIFNKNKNKN